MVYNESLLDAASGPIGWISAVNTLSGLLFMNLILVAIAIFAFLGFKKSELDDIKNMIATSGITSLFATWFLLKNWITLYTAWVPYAVLVLTIIYYKITEE